MKNSQKGFIMPLLLALIAILLVGGGAYVYTQNRQANQPAASSPTQATSTTQTPNQTIPVTQTPNSQTTDWKMYTNVDYGFSISIPKEWNQDPIYSKKDNVIFAQKVEKQGETFKLIFRPGDAVTYPDNKGEVTIAGVNWKITGASDIEGYSIKYSTSLNGVKYDFIVHNEDETLLKQLLSTFKFTSSNTSTSIIVDPKTVKVGDVVGNWTVSSINKLSFYPDGSPASGFIFFTGSAVVTGVVGVNDMTGAIIFAPTPDGGAQIPVFKGFNDKPENKAFSLSGDTQKLSSSAGQNITVEIGNLGVSFEGKGGSGPFAKLIRVIQATSNGTAGASKITILSPNGGEIITNGSLYTIRWTSSGVDASQSVEIDLERKLPTDTQYWNIGTISTNQPGSGSYEWTVPTTDSAGKAIYGTNQFKILIGRSLAKGTGAVDESDAPFTIYTPNPGGGGM